MTESGDRERKEREEQNRSSLADAYRKAAPYTAASTSLVVAVGGCTWLGHLADEHWGFKVPWLTLVGAALGMTAGFISFFKTVLGNAKKP
jgi:F0F1-type ATP synthase assembly protein I